MRKLTYKQAAECGENLKARVTPEQSEKMQRAWFAAGKMWQTGHTNIIKKPEKNCLFMDGNLLSYGDDYDFKRDRSKEIELIDDIPQTDFASQQDVWVWLGQAKNQVKRINNGDIVYFKNGVLWDLQLDRQCHWQFLDFEEWQKHTPLRLIRVNGVEVPAPLESLDGFDSAWFVDITNKEKAFKIDVGKSKCSANLNRWIKLGLLYATKEDAIKRAEAMLKFEAVK